MLGKKAPTSKLSCQFSLEEPVPTDHLLTRAAAVDFTFVRWMTGRFCSHTDQPSIDPVVIFKMALLSCLQSITSGRRLVREIRLNLAYLWFIGYDLDEPVPALVPPERTEQSTDRAGTAFGTGTRPSRHRAGPGDAPNKAVGLLNERMVSPVDPEAELVQ